MSFIFTCASEITGVGANFHNLSAKIGRPRPNRLPDVMTSLPLSWEEKMIKNHTKVCYYGQINYAFLHYSIITSFVSVQGKNGSS